jgi:peptidyl-prolyl cis-trans isomerase C
MRRHSKKKNFTKIFIATTIVAASIFATYYYFLNKENDLVIATVNNQKIFKLDVEKKLRNVFEGQNFSSSDQEVKIPAIETLPSEVIEIIAKEIYLEKQLTKEAKKSKSNNKETAAKIIDLQEKILRQTYTESLIKEEVNDQKISEKYSELINQLNGKKEYLTFHIVVKNKEEADKLKKELNSKKAPKFSELAKKYSIDQETAVKGGELGYIMEEYMIKEIFEVLPKLKKEEISNPIQTKFGWHLIKVSEVRDVKAQEFEAVKENIRQQLIQEKINEINSRITKEAKVKILISLKKENPISEKESLNSKSTASETVESTDLEKSNSVKIEEKIEQPKNEEVFKEQEPEAKKDEKQNSKNKE